MKNYWCESCDNRWQADGISSCPNCKSDEVRQTMSKEEAEERGLA